MNATLKAAFSFGSFGALASLPIVWFFWSLFASSARGVVVWSSMPFVAFASSSCIAYFMARSAQPPFLGVARGILVALASLLVSSSVVAASTLQASGFIFVFAALFWCGWFVALIGGLAGWATQKYVLAKP